MRRLLAVAAFGLMFASAGISRAWAGGATPTTVVASQGTVTVKGQAVFIHVQVRDAKGRPVTGALVRLLVPVSFMGSTKDEIVGEGTTNETGHAAIRFAPAQTGAVQGTIAFWGSQGYAPSEATIALDVQSPVFTYAPEPIGIQAWWARSYFILVPFIVIWSIYLMLLWLVVRVKRAGAAASAPSDIAATN